MNIIPAGPGWEILRLEFEDMDEPRWKTVKAPIVGWKVLGGNLAVPISIVGCLEFDALEDATIAPGGKIYVGGHRFDNVDRYVQWMWVGKAICGKDRLRKGRAIGIVRAHIESDRASPMGEWVERFPEDHEAILEE
jgi:hypothetical protein